MATEVSNYRELLDRQQARANGYLLEMEHPMARRVPVNGSPVSVNGEIARQAPLPNLGQHTEEVMLEVGYTWHEITAMRESGAIA